MSTETKEQKLERLITDLWRGYPSWPSTFGPCCNKGCSNSARGCGKCAHCTEAEIGELIGDEPLAGVLRAKVAAAKTAELEVREALRQ